jgi:alginate O-acetyltransferase complex protein AlgI
VTCYTLQIYFDFSGYSDMALGLALLFGFHFPENFNYPYISQSVQEFWRRWHISLSTWFRDYVYIPLGGNRCAPWRVYVNLVTVFFLCGLWHGASWTFVIWGLFHGLFLALERGQFGQWVISSGTLVRHVYTLGVVMVGWVFFRAETLSYALSFLAAMSGFRQGSGHEYHAGFYLDAKVIWALVVGLVAATPILPLITSTYQRMLVRYSPRGALVLEGTFMAGSLIGLGLIFLGSAMVLAAGSHNPFIYFRF